MKNLCNEFNNAIERTLKELLEAGFTEKVGKGRAIGYVKKRPKSAKFL